MKHWYAIHCKPRKEKVVAKQLASREIEYYFPQEKDCQDSNSPEFGKPFFAGYLFVFVDIQEKGFNEINFIPFTHGLVTYGSVPAQIPENFILDLQRYLRDYQKKISPSDQIYKPGDKIKVKEGVLEGMEGIFKGTRSSKKRAVILLNLIQDHFINIEIPIKQLRPK